MVPGGISARYALIPYLKGKGKVHSERNPLPQKPSLGHSNPSNRIALKKQNYLTVDNPHASKLELPTAIKSVKQLGYIHIETIFTDPGSESWMSPKM